MAGPLRALSLELVYLEDLDARLREADDWRVVLGVRGAGLDGLVTNDGNMTEEPRVLPALKATRLTLVIVESLGHDPVRATGALLLDLPGIAKRVGASGPAIFRLRHRVPDPTPVPDALAKRARKIGMTVPELLREEGIRPAELLDPFE